ncbi:MAG: CorA family divalent cation transporter, partial [Planctomycetota bacterium]
ADHAVAGRFDAPEVLPRIEERSECLAFHLYEVEDPERLLDVSHGLDPLRFARVALVLGSDFLVTYHRRPLDAVEYVKGACEESFRLAGKTPGFLAFLFLERCLYDYAHVNLANDNFLDGLASRLPMARELPRGVAVAGSNILALKKLAASLHIVLMRLGGKRNPFISDEARAAFHDMIPNAIAVRGAIDSSRQLLDAIVGGAQAAATVRTSEIARVLTILSGVLLPLTLVAGVYGMNFEPLPGSRSPAGFWAAVAAMLALAIALLWIFRRLGWLGGRRGAA